MTLSDISIKNPVFAWMLMAALMLFGIISFTRLGISQMPDVDFPGVNISVNLEGASPEIMESDVADVLEDAVTSVQGVQEVRSTCRQGRASIQVELDINLDVDVALQEIQTKVLQAQGRLPREIDPPVISKNNPEDQPILWLAVSSDRPLKDLMVYVKDTLKDQFQTLPGVGEVFLGGYVDRNLRIWLDGKKLSARALTADDVIATVERDHIEVPAGRLELPLQEMNVRVLGEAPTVQAFSDIPISSRGGAPVHRVIRLKEVADIVDGLDDVRRISRFNGLPAVGLGIRKQRGANAVETAEMVIKRMEEVRKKLPEGYRIDVSFDATRFIKNSIHELQRTLILSALLTGIVCWFFLGSFTSTLNILLAIPTSILGTLIVIDFCGFTLNTFTLLALSLSIGVVVDDAIMVLENIVRHRESGENRVEGAIKGARQITFAATATTLSIVAIFLPVVFMQGIMGKFFFQFGVVISAAVLLSLLEALTLTPMRCSQFLQVRGHSPGTFFERVDNGYRALSNQYGRLLKWGLDFRSSLLIADAKSKDFPQPAFLPYRFFLCFLATLAMATALFVFFAIHKWVPWGWLKAILDGLYAASILAAVILYRRPLRLFAAKVLGLETGALQVEIQTEIKNPRYSAVPIFFFFLGISFFILAAFDFWIPLACLAGLFFVLWFLFAYVSISRNSTFPNPLHDFKFWAFILSTALSFSVKFPIIVAIVNIHLPFFKLSLRLPELFFSCALILILAQWFFYFYRHRYFFFAHIFYDHRWAVLATASAFFLTSFQALPFLKKEMVPQQDQSVFMVRLKTPVGSSIEMTDALVKQCEAYIKTRKEVLRFYTAVGGFGGGEVNTAIMFITMFDKKDRPVVAEEIKMGFGPKAPVKKIKGKLTQHEFQDVVRRDLSKISKDLTAFAQDLSMRGLARGGRQFGVEFTIQGSDWGKLASLSEEMKKRLKESGKVVDVDSDYEVGQPEVQIVPNREAATLRAVSVSAIGNTIGALMGGRRAGKFTEGGHRYDARVRLKLDQRLSVKDLEGLFVRNNRGELVRLSEVVTVKEKSSLQSIRRINRIRAITVQGNPALGTDQQTALATAMKIGKEILPDGYRMELSGAAAGTRESFNSLLFALLLGIVVAYMILGSQFNSFIHPVSVLLALPFSFSGAILALLLCDKVPPLIGFEITGSTFNMYSFIGLILLMGLVKKNSILLVDFTNQKRAASPKIGVTEALLEACPMRLRPILMTSIATIAAAIPIAMALGAGAEVLRPMAIAVIGGMIFSTVLSLVVVPCAYSLLSGLERNKPVEAKEPTKPKTRLISQR